MVTVKEQKEKEEQYLKDQSEYNKTGDTNILWFKMEPFIREMAQSMLKKLSKNHRILYFEDKVDEVVDILIKRYVKDYKKNYALPKTMVYWASYKVMYSSTSRSLDAEKEYIAKAKEELFDECYRIGENKEYE